MMVSLYQFLPYLLSLSSFVVRSFDLSWGNETDNFFFEPYWNETVDTGNGGNSNFAGIEGGLSNSISCSVGEMSVEVIMILASEKENSWTLSKLETAEIIWSNEGNPKQFNEAKCIPDGSYKFMVYDAYGDGINGYYALKVNQNLITEEGTQSPAVHWSFKETIICSNDADCGISCPTQKCNKVTKACEIHEKIFDKKTCRSFGNPSALVLRVVADDAEHSKTLDELRNYVFGMNSKQLLSMAQQFRDCSFGRFNITPFSRRTSSGININKGAIDLRLTRSVKGEQVSTIVTETLEMAKAMLGDLENQFDFLLICMPPGTKLGESNNWKAYAYVNGANSIYNDGQCSSLSVLMHEVGHNIGLSHSNDEKNYGDKSGQMGLSVGQVGGPRRCFNGAKSWQLGWYHEGHRILDFGSDIMLEGQWIDIVGSAVFPFSRLPVIVKLINTGDGYDYYFQYNINIGMNSGTREGANQVLTTRRVTGCDYADSFLVSKLSSGQSNTILYIENKHDLKIEVDATGSPPGAISMSVGRTDFTFRPCWKDSHCDDFNTCTEDKCEMYGQFSGRCRNNQVTCDLCGKETIMAVKTNTFPSALQWRIKNIVSDRVFMVNQVYYKQNHDYKTSYCLPHGKYSFSFSYDENTTVVNGAEFNLVMGGITIDSGTYTKPMFFESYFIICGSDKDCYDFDGCTIDSCNTKTKLCNNVEVDNKQTECIHCTWLSLGIKMDNFPEETTWGLYKYLNSFTQNKNEFVFAGNPYSFDVGTAFGRSKAPTKSGRRKAPTRAGRRKAPTRSSMKALNNIRRRRLDNAHEISEEICIENDMLFYFRIEDSFGDGMCCTEGSGGFSLETNGHVLKTGGDFKESEELLFQFKNCNSATDCDDDDACTTNECITTLNVCTFTKRPCNECGLNAQVDIQTDNQPYETFWNLIQNEDTLLVEKGPLLSPNAAVKTDLCLTFGSYSFTIFDTSADGIMNGGYKLKLGDVLIASGSTFGQEEKTIFAICKTDTDCDDGDPCTKDSCNIQKKVCIFQKLACSECNSGKVFVEFENSIISHTQRWEVKAETNKAKYVMKGGPYASHDKFYEDRCLPVGMYHFYAYCLNGAAQLSYKIHVNGEVVSFGSKSADDAHEVFYVYPQPANPWK